MSRTSSLVDVLAPCLSVAGVTGARTPSDPELDGNPVDSQTIGRVFDMSTDQTDWVERTAASLDSARTLLYRPYFAAILVKSET